MYFLFILLLLYIYIYICLFFFFFLGGGGVVVTLEGNLEPKGANGHHWATKGAGVYKFRALDAK